jgi:hypothetical protein
LKPHAHRQDILIILPLVAHLIHHPFDEKDPKPARWTLVKWQTDVRVGVLQWIKRCAAIG